MLKFFKGMLLSAATRLNEPAKLHVYLAGPDVFKPHPLQVGKQKKRLVENAGHVAHFPIDPDLDDLDELGDTPRAAYKIAASNERLMRESQVILLNMIPWRGPSMDVGTAFEAGYMSARADHDPTILIIGYYEGEHEWSYLKRVLGSAAIRPDKQGVYRDDNGMSVENFGLSDNLMIPAAIEKTGGSIFLSFAEAVAHIGPLWQKKQDAVLRPRAVLSS